MNDHPWFAKYDKGVPKTIDYPKKPLFHFLEDSASKYPDRACTIFKGAVISYKEMNEITDRIAAALVDMAIGQSYHVSGSEKACHLLVTGNTQMDELTGR